MAKLSECKASTGHQLATSKDVYCALIFMLKKCTLQAIIINRSIKLIHKTSIGTQNNCQSGQTFSLAINLTGYVNIGNQKKGHFHTITLEERKNLKWCSDWLWKMITDCHGITKNLLLTILRPVCYLFNGLITSYNLLMTLIWYIFYTSK